MAEFEAAVRDRAPTAIVHMRGDLDGRADAAVNAAYREAALLAPEAVVLNFEDVGYVNSTGIALIVGILAEARRAAIAVRVCGLSDHYRHIFEITRLADFMSFFPDEESAVGDGLTAPA